MALAFTCSFTALAQTKVAHIDGQKLLESMPEVKAAIDSVNKQTEMYTREISKMEKDLQDAYVKYQQEAPSLPQAIRESREKAILAQQQGLEDFKETASGDLDGLQRKLLEGPTEKAKKGIEEVAKANGIAYVLDISVQTVLYAGGEDLLEKVQTHLGIPKSAASPAPGPVAPRR